MITIVDLDMGNSRSIVNMLYRLGIKSEITRDHKKIDQAQKIILPGVGSFDTAMKNLERFELIELLNKKAKINKIPFLGICLGMQILTNYSQEGFLNGLGWIEGSATKFDTDSNTKVPHMGWNYVKCNQNSKLFKNIDLQSRFYFVHSYYVRVKNREQASMTTSYSLEFDSAIEKENIFGVQFHPEKSHKFGMQVLRNFDEISC
jgi:imidazole glycerol-phosphate synthase subunit HisH